MDVAFVYKWDGLETTRVTKVQVVTKCECTSYKRLHMWHQICEVMSTSTAHCKKYIAVYNLELLSCAATQCQTGEK